MFKSLLTLVTFILAGTAFCEAACRFTDQIRPVNVNFAELAKKKLNIVYASETDFSVIIDHAYINLTETEHNTYNTTITVVRKDGRTEYRHFTTEYRDGVLPETYREDGLSATATSYILDVTDEGGILWYRCSDSDLIYNEEDLRQIIAPDGITLSDDSVKQLLETDKKFNFTGNFIRLPHNL